MALSPSANAQQGGTLVSHERAPTRLAARPPGVRCQQGASVRASPLDHGPKENERHHEQDGSSILADDERGNCQIDHRLTCMFRWRLPPRFLPCGGASLSIAVAATCWSPWDPAWDPSLGISGMLSQYILSMLRSPRLGYSLLQPTISCMLLDNGLVKRGMQCATGFTCRILTYHVQGRWVLTKVQNCTIHNEYAGSNVIATIVLISFLFACVAARIQSSYYLSSSKIQ
jgi:hypothetical protein